MDTKKSLAKVIGGVLVGGLLLPAGIAFAQLPGSDSGNISGKTPTVNARNVHGEGHFKAGRCEAFSTKLDQLVKDGVITQEKAGQIKAFVDKRMQEKKARREQWKKLTPEQRKALKEKWQKEKSAGGRGGLFTELVKNKIITQQEADTIKAKMKEKASR